MGTRLIMPTLLLLIVILILGWVSIDSQFYALEAASGSDASLDVAQARYDLGKPVTIEAELLPEGRDVVLMPQARDVLVRDGKAVTQHEGSFDFTDGKFYYWGDVRPKRAWVFVVISEDKPKVTVEH